jgi:hypothetical protein
VAHYRYKKDTLTWTPAGEEEPTPLELVGVQAIEIVQEGQTTDIVQDSEELVQELPLAGIKGTLAITLNDQAQAALLEPGLGLLAWAMEPVASGRGPQPDADALLVEAAAAVLRRISVEALSGAGGGLSLDFEVGADEDGEIFQFSTYVEPEPE